MRYINNVTNVQSVNIRNLNFLQYRHALVFGEISKYVSKVPFVSVYILVNSGKFAKGELSFLNTFYYSSSLRLFFYQLLVHLILINFSYSNYR